MLFEAELSMQQHVSRIADVLFTSTERCIGSVFTFAELLVCLLHCMSVFYLFVWLCRRLLRKYGPIFMKLGGWMRHFVSFKTGED